MANFARKNQEGIKFRTVEVKVRELALSPEDLASIRPRHGGGKGKCVTISTPSNIKTQRFSKKENTTASFGNITVCGEDLKDARVKLAQRLYGISKPVVA